MSQFLFLFITLSVATAHAGDSPFIFNTASVSDGLNGTYSAGQWELHFETARLPRDKEVYSEDSDRDYDVAIRISDGYGQLLFSLLEGHDYPEYWQAESEVLGDGPIDPVVYGLARRAAMGLAELEFNEELQTEQVLLGQALMALGE